MNPPSLRTHLVAGLLAGACAAPTAAHDNPLVAERWQTRPLVVVAPTPAHPLLASLRSQLAGSEQQRGFEEREMVLYTVVGGQGQRQGQMLSGAQTIGLLGALGASADGPATVFLVGKDGGIKLREQADQMSLGEVFTLIDGMPMRRR